MHYAMRTVHYLLFLSLGMSLSNAQVTSADNYEAGILSRSYISDMQRQIIGRSAYGNVQEKTFRAGEKVDTAEIFRSDMQYTYNEGDTYVFMDMQTYEETRLEKSDWAKFLKVEETVSMVEWNGKVISVDLPKVVSLEVTDTDPGVKGNTKDSGGTKPATLETGAVVNVPLFISIGEKLMIDTETGAYVSRDTGK